MAISWVSLRSRLLGDPFQQWNFRPPHFCLPPQFFCLPYESFFSHTKPFIFPQTLSWFTRFLISRISSIITLTKLLCLSLLYLSRWSLPGLTQELITSDFVATLYLALLYFSIYHIVLQLFKMNLKHSNMFCSSLTANIFPLLCFLN